MRKVLITGGSRGIGAACVRMFAENGDRVVFFYHTHREEAEKIANETGAVAIRADISDGETIQKAVKQAADLMGGIDVLVNNAGISQIGLFTDFTDEEIHRCLDTDLFGAICVARESARYMISNHSGRIINVGSVWGRTGASCEVVYSAAKAGVRGMTFALAKELGPSHITVNCIEPGVIQTDMNAALSPDTVKQLIDETPLCRLGTPEDVASAIFFLASDQASFITAQALGIDGGFGG